MLHGPRRGGADRAGRDEAERRALLAWNEFPSDHFTWMARVTLQAAEGTPRHAASVMDGRHPQGNVFRGLTLPRLRHARERRIPVQLVLAVSLKAAHARLTHICVSAISFPKQLMGARWRCGCCILTWTPAGRPRRRRWGEKRDQKQEPRGHILGFSWRPLRRPVPLTVLLHPQGRETLDLVTLTQTPTPSLTEGSTQRSPSPPTHPPSLPPCTSL
ncbi:hypothetical protein E2C01_063698 [Portunus trituberculatus]|uniref:Uncharacterized protein n=1 Tax=Portunus trituberculatus TaxID=210409 RepID=A0A5B7HEC9_PORTR|nr:hypothetical protein [Portunus trituberculatus]